LHPCCMAGGLRVVKIRESVVRPWGLRLSRDCSGWFWLRIRGWF